MEATQPVAAEPVAQAGDSAARHTLSVDGDSHIYVTVEHPSIAGRQRRNKAGGNGKDCGVINVEFFGTPADSWLGKDLFRLASEVALRHPAFVEHWAACGLFKGKRTHTGAVKASHVASYIARGNRITNLAMALLAKAIGADIYVVSYRGVVEKQRTVCVTKYAHNRELDGKSTIGEPVGEDELCEAFARYLGPVLFFSGGHWSAFPRKGPLGEESSDSSGLRPRRFCASYK